VNHAIRFAGLAFVTAVSVHAAEPEDAVELKSESRSETKSSTMIDSKFELFVTDIEKSISFYTTVGFVVAHQKSGGYTTLQKGSTVIALSPIPSWVPLRWVGFLRSPPIGTEIVLYTRHLEALRAALESGGYTPGPIKRQSWGDRDFRIRDYDGYYVRISDGQAIPPLEASSPE
jgi:hypothetical protein